MADDYPLEAYGWAARDSSGTLSPFNFNRKAVDEEDVKIKVLYCGICHSDVHHLTNYWGASHYPLVPGHEITGIVTEVGSKVKNFKVGDKVGVGCMYGSCGVCDSCVHNLESYCNRKIMTANSFYYDGTPTYGGYSGFVVVYEHFVVHIPDNLSLDAAAPLLCAGITPYSALRHFGLDKPGKNVAVLGLGGVGHVAVKIAKAFGATVTVISSNPDKRYDALEVFGADSFILSSDSDQMETATDTLDGILDTAPAPHPLQPLFSLLKRDGKLVVLGAPNTLEVPIVPLLGGRKGVEGSQFGGMKETQEMIDFCGKYNITANIEIIPIDHVNTAIQRLVKADVRYRFVIDVANTINVAR